MKAGVYKITNTITNQIYIGSTNSLQDRLNNHRSKLRLGTHYCKQMQEDYNNKNKLVFKVLEVCKNYLEREQYYLDKIDNLYNVCKVAGSTKGLESTRKLKIDQYTLSGNYIKTWESLQEIMTAFNLSSSSKISMVCNGKRNVTQGFIWRYHKEELGNITFIKKGKGIAEINEKGTIIKTWDRVKDCAEEVGARPAKLCQIMNPENRMKTHNGRRFIYN